MTDDVQDREPADPLLTAVGEMRATIGLLVSQPARVVVYRFAGAPSDKPGERAG